MRHTKLRRGMRKVMTDGARSDVIPLHFFRNATIPHTNDFLDFAKNTAFEALLSPSIGKHLAKIALPRSARSFLKICYRRQSNRQSSGKNCPSESWQPSSRFGPGLQKIKKPATACAIAGPTQTTNTKIKAASSPGRARHKAGSSWLPFRRPCWRDGTWCP